MTTPTKRRASAGGAGPSRLAENPVEYPSDYTKAEAHASVTPYQAKRLSGQRLALIRISELVRLANFYRQIGIRVDADLFLFALAVALSCVRPGTVILQGRAIPQHGLDILTLREAAQRANLGHISDDELWTKIQAVSRYHDKKGKNDLGAKWLGDRLQLTSAERSECRITTIEAVDEPKAEREDRKAEEKRAKDRTYNRTQRNRTPRPVYLAAAEERRRLCKEYGISQRTLHRWLKDGKLNVRSPTLDHIESKTRTSDFGHGAEQDANSSVADPSGTGRSSRSVARAAGWTEFPEPGSEMKERSEKEDPRMSSGSSAVLSRGLNASRMGNSGEPTVTFDPSKTIALLIEAEAVLSEQEETRKLAASIGLFRLQLEIEQEAQPEDDADTLRIGIDHLVPRLRAANDNRLNVLIQRLAA